MSDLIVKVVTIDEVCLHPNADKLEIVKIGGWQIVSGKGNYVAGQTAVHVPPDVMVPKALADQWAVTPYLSWKKDAEKGRVKAVKLRGATSFGFLAPNDTNAEVGENLADKLGIEKYEEPVPIGASAGQMARQHPLFHTYTDIQNLRNYPQELNYGELLVVTEKIHGTNSRVGWVRNDDTLEKVVGTHHTQRKIEDCGVYGLPFELYGEAFDQLLELILKLLEQDVTMGPDGIERPERLNSLIVFGEIYGAGVQDLHYGATAKKGYRVFDIAINGEYMNAMAMETICKEVGLPTVPILARGVFSYEDLLQLAQGNTTLDDKHIREGIVVRPMVQELTWGKGTFDPNPKRMIFKVINDDYLTRKNGTEYH